MTVYVDPARLPFQGQLYCHMWADSLHELHLAAQAVGIRRSWFQAPPKASWHHYDCAPRIRAMLVARGAVETDRFGPAEFEARRKGDTAMLDRIAAARARRAAESADVLPDRDGPAAPPAPFVHLCFCGAWGCRGFKRGGETVWFCFEHRTMGERGLAA